MAIEKFWERVSPRSLTANGTVDGVVTLPFALDFRVKQRVTLRANTVQSKTVEVKRVVSPTVLEVGRVGHSIKDREDVSAFTTALSATLEADEQPRPAIPDKEYMRAMYAEEPTVAMRSHLVDYYGRTYTANNPLPVSADYSKILEVIGRSKWMDQAVYDRVSVSGPPDRSSLQFDYYEDGNVIGTALVTFVSDVDWSFQLNRYLLDDDGSKLLDDDDSELLLE